MKYRATEDGGFERYFPGNPFTHPTNPNLDTWCPGEWRPVPAESVPHESRTALLRELLFRVALHVKDPDMDHVERCVAIYRIVGEPDEWIDAEGANDG